MNCNAPRAIALVLTIATAFAVLALPASAANDTAVTEEQAQAAQALVFTTTEYLGKDEVYEIDTKDYYYARGGGSTLGESGWTEFVLILCNDQGSAAIYIGTVPAGAMIGYQNINTKQVIWLTIEDNRQTSDGIYGSPDLVSADWDSGVITINGKAYETLSSRLKQTEAEQKQTDNNNNNTGNSSTGTTLMLAGGAAVAVTAVYLYTHTAVFQKVVSGVQSALGRLTGKTAESTVEAVETIDAAPAA